MIDRLTLPYSAKLETAKAFLYFYRNWFFEGIDGLSGRTGVVLFINTPAPACVRFCCVDRYQLATPYDMIDYNEPLEHVVLADGSLPCHDFERIFADVSSHGIFDMPSQPALSTGHYTDTVGVQASTGEEHWYEVRGGYHADPRHNQHIRRLFLSDLGLGSYLTALNAVDAGPHRFGKNRSSGCAQGGKVNRGAGAAGVYKAKGHPCRCPDK